MVYPPIRLIFLIVLFCPYEIIAQTLYPDAVATLIDSCISNPKIRPFNGIVILEQQGRIIYQKCAGDADFNTKSPLTFDHQFVAGSISKQITAVLILREMDKGNLDLHTPVRKYLPQLQPAWADTVTVFHLLNHTSGIRAYDQPLAFSPGTQFAYSGVGYGMLSDILEAVTGKSYARMSRQLFKKCRMKNTTDPTLSDLKKLAKPYSRQQNGQIKEEKNALKNNIVAAGLIVSTPQDLVQWNRCLHGGKLLKPATYQQMITASSQRDHPVFGPVGYGFGLQTHHEGGVISYGHGGYVPGFITINFYFPQSQTSLVVMENLDWNTDDFRLTFAVEKALYDLVVGSLK